MLSIDDKTHIAKTLDFCWYLNLNDQMKCQEIFGSLNTIWNRIFFVHEQTSDLSNFRNLIEDILKDIPSAKLITWDGLIHLSEIKPLIKDDYIELSRNNNIESNNNENSTSKHEEYINYFQKIQSNPSNKIKKKFLGKLTRLLYLIRSNIAHGSKSQYQGSERNEIISRATYFTLKHILNVALDNALFKIAAYGELKRDGNLFKPLVKQKNGKFLYKAKVKGNLIYSKNTLMYDPINDLNEVDVEILEFSNANSIHDIDLVECMPRRFRSYQYNVNEVGYAWIYERFLSIENHSGPIYTFERTVSLELKIKTFLFALISIRQKFINMDKISNEQAIKIFGKLTINTTNYIHYEKHNHNTDFSHPYGQNFIKLIDEIGNSYKAIFNSLEDLLPFTDEIDGAIYHDKDLHNEFYNRFYPSDDNKNVPPEMYRHLVKDIIYFVGDWGCRRIGDFNADLWTEVDSTNQVIN